MDLYSFKGNEPEPLPNRIRLESGFTVTSLDKLSKEDLLSYGFVGPIKRPNFDPMTDELIWNGTSYILNKLSLEEVEKNENIILENETIQLIENINFNVFWTEFIKTKFNYRLRDEALNNKVIEILYNQFISKTGLVENSDVNLQILYSLNKFFTLVSFTPEEIESYYDIIKKHNVNLIYTITPQDIDNYKNNYYYDYVTDSLIEKTNIKPYDSWIWSGEKWESPIKYPNDGKVYLWNESEVNWQIHNN